MIKSVFNNELGNKIVIRIKNQRDKGTNFKTKEELDSIENPGTASDELNRQIKESINNMIDNHIKEIGNILPSIMIESIKKEAFIAIDML
jgi:hypothetical protein